MNTSTPVTVLGLGLMGTALASAFLRAGHPTTVWNRTAAKAAPLVAAGARPAASIAEAVAASPLVIVCLTDAAAVRQVLADPDARWDGRTLVNLTSGTPADARGLATATTLAGVILAAPAEIGGDALLLYSGPRDLFDAHSATLGVLAGASTYLGADPGLASLYDVASLGVMWNLLNGFLHGAAVAGAAGVEATSFAPVAVHVVRTVTSWLTGVAEQIDSCEYPGSDSTLDTHVAAMEHLLAESAALGVSTELPAFVKTLAGRAVAAGHGAEGYPVLIEQFRG